MAHVTFLNDSTIEVIALDGEKFTYSTMPVPPEKRQFVGELLAASFDKNFSDDKTSMTYWVSMETFGLIHIWYYTSDRSEERERLGARIREIRESKGMEARIVAKLANIDAANFSRIEGGRYSAGIDVLARIGQALGVKLDFV